MSSTNDLTVAPHSKTIKERLLDRFIHARTVLGQGWQRKVIALDSYYDTFDGAQVMTKAGQAVTNPGMIGVDRLERLVLVMEEAAGIQNPPVV